MAKQIDDNDDDDGGGDDGNEMMMVIVMMMMKLSYDDKMFMMIRHSNPSCWFDFVKRNKCHFAL